MIRALLLLLILAPLGWWLDREQKAGRFQRVDELFLDFLVANSREKLTTPDPAAPEGQVLLLRLDPAQRDEFSAWPPAPIDWQMILKGLRDAEPEVVVIPEPLNWPKPTPDFVPAVAEAIIPLSSVVFGVEAKTTEKADEPTFLGALDESLPRFQKAAGELQSAPGIAAVLAAPHDDLRRHGELGLVIEKGLPYAFRADERLVPGLLAQTLARHTRTPYVTHRLLLGPGAGAYLQGGFFVPLQNDGTVELEAKKKLSTANALDLLTGGLADAVSAEDKEKLKAAKIIVIGQDDAKQPGVARTHAQALADMLSLPKIRVLDEMEQWIVWGVVALLGMWLVLRVPRQKAPARGFLLIFIVVVIVFLAFQTALLWFPPTLPIALLSASAVVGGIIGRRESAPVV